MSRELSKIETSRGEVQLTQFHGKDGIEGLMLQVTQGDGDGPDAPGFIQLTSREAVKLADAIKAWAAKTASSSDKKKSRRSRILAFELSMPGVGSWDGKWSGKGDHYVVVKNYGASKRGREQAEEILDKKSYGYDFGDGWFARVKVREVSASEVRSLRKGSSGFAGYDWMISSIERHGEIRPGG